MFRVFILLAVFLPLSACASFKGVPRHYEDQEGALERFHAGIATARAQYEGARGQEATLRQARNDLIFNYMAIIDIRYTQYVSGLSSENSTINVAADSLSTAFNAAGAITSAGQTSQVLSALSATITGARDSIDKHALYDAAVPAVIAQMNANRLVVMNRLMAGSQLSTSEYPLSLAVLDIQSYYQAGTIHEASVALSAAASSDLEEAQKESVVLQREYFAPERQDKVRELIGLINALESAQLVVLTQSLNLNAAGLREDFADLNVNDQRQLLRQYLFSDQFDRTNDRVIERWTAAIRFAQLPQN